MENGVAFSDARKFKTKRICWHLLAFTSNRKKEKLRICGWLNKDYVVLKQKLCATKAQNTLINLSIPSHSRLQPVASETHEKYLPIWQIPLTIPWYSMAKVIGIFYASFVHNVNELGGSEEFTCILGCFSCMWNRKEVF